MSETNDAAEVRRHIGRSSPVVERGWLHRLWQYCWIRRAVDRALAETRPLMSHARAPARYFAQASYAPEEGLMLHSPVSRSHPPVRADAPPEKLGWVLLCPDGTGRCADIVMRVEQHRRFQEVTGA